MKLAFKLFLFHGENYVFGPGRWEILKAIRELGSLRQAAISMGMSYRWAWGRIRDVEEALGFPILIEDPQSTKARRAKILSPEGCELLNWFESISHELNTQITKYEKNMPEFLKNVADVEAPKTKKGKLAANVPADS